MEGPGATAAASEKALAERLGLAGKGVPLIIASMETGDLRAAWFLLERGADPNASVSEITALMYAASKGLVETCERLVASGADVNARGNRGKTVLMCACMAPHPAAARFLIGCGADVNARTDRGMTALIYSCKVNDYGMASLLLAGGADPNARDRHGMTPLMHACESACAGADDASPFGAGVALARLLLGRGADPNSRDNHGVTPLMFASEKGRGSGVALAELLIEKGADPNARDSDGMTALMFAAETDNAGVARLLVSRGADADAREASVGTNALIVAIEASSAETALYLIEAGADAWTPDSFGSTPLIHACKGGHVEIAAKLLARGRGPANAGEGERRRAVNARGERGMTALMFACQGNHRDLVELLFAYCGAHLDAGAECWDGSTALALACERNHAGIAKALLRDPHADATGSGAVALMHAYRHGNREVARLLLERGALPSASEFPAWTHALHREAARGARVEAELLRADIRAVERRTEAARRALAAIRRTPGPGARPRLKRGAPGPEL